MQKLLIIISFCIALCAGYAETSSAATLTVCSSGCDYTTIQAAHDMANPDDIIDVLDSIHTEYGITISKNLTIQGQDQSSTIVQAAATPNTAPNRVFIIDVGAIVTIQNMTIRHGYVDSLNWDCDCQNKGDFLYGGAICNAGDTEIKNVTIEYNTIKGPSGFFWEVGHGFGGGIYSCGVLSIDKCIIRHNVCQGGRIIEDSMPGGYVMGGGVCISYQGGPSTISNTTIYSNSAIGGNGISGGGSAYGGGIYATNADLIMINNCTVNDNYTQAGDCIGMDCYLSWDSHGGGIYTNNSSIRNTTISNNYVYGPDYPPGQQQGSGIYSSATNAFNNTIVWNSIYGDITSEDYNLIQSHSGGTIYGTITHNIYGQNPLLGPLTDNGGPTLTHALLPGSPAIDAGSCSVSEENTDQRGLSRPRDIASVSNVDDGCDIGAFEVYVPQGGEVVINEVAWSGTAASLNDEWMELYNTVPAHVDLSGWKLIILGDKPRIINLFGTIDSFGYYILERDDNSTISDVVADQLFTFGLNDLGEKLTLLDDFSNTIDTANYDDGSWPGGTVLGYYSMERVNPLIPDIDANWLTNNGIVRNGLDANSNPINGTPGNVNSVFNENAVVPAVRSLSIVIILFFISISISIHRR